MWNSALAEYCGEMGFIFSNIFSGNLYYMCAERLNKGRKEFKKVKKIIPISYIKNES